MDQEQTIVNENGITEEPGVDTEKHNAPPNQIVIIFQLALCILIAAALFIIKSMGGSLYDSIREYYFSNMNNSLITEFDSDNDIASMLVNEDQGF